MHGMTSSMTPKMGIAAEEKKDEADRPVMEPGAEGPGVRDWFGTLPKATKSNRAAALTHEPNSALPAAPPMASHDNRAGMGTT
jgi:hypothetical protein